MNSKMWMVGAVIGAMVLAPLCEVSAEQGRGENDGAQTTEGTRGRGGRGHGRGAGANGYGGGAGENGSGKNQGRNGKRRCHRRGNDDKPSQ